MTKYFQMEGSRQTGRLKTSIVTTLRRDLKSHNSDHWTTRLHLIKDLDHLRDIAQNSLSMSLRRDLKSHNSDHWTTRLHLIKDLDHRRDIAQNSLSDWKHLTTAIYRDQPRQRRQLTLQRTGI
ncbi:hypothetical protein ElyMa_006482100 [Elysia marginata]|uniref:Uncharacterized protein n=1 Tax=Elysia marginata TaxID=1093978 RepID=A0AAV4I1W0_9GAST|nr:hypothetical protein ElyMa_006482100 [Elysia marginata]